MTSNTVGESIIFLAFLVSFRTFDVSVFAMLKTDIAGIA
jgi:hypothetical protein